MFSPAKKQFYFVALSTDYSKRSVGINQKAAQFTGNPV